MLVYVVAKTRRGCVSDSADHGRAIIVGQALKGHMNAYSAQNRIRVGVRTLE
jgi:hypothetical protein